eukprot:Nk52_evm27s224 gene=Nk52_evmTU27s224
MKIHPMRVFDEEDYIIQEEREGGSGGDDTNHTHTGISAPPVAHLNPQQRAAVRLSPSGASAIIAGPGTGKTHTLVCRAVYLIKECGIPPEDITLVTFTNKAASEMKQRLGEYLQDPLMAERVHAGTFHGLLAKGLRQFGDSIDIPENFSIADSKDLAKALKTVLEDFCGSAVASGGVKKKKNDSPNVKDLGTYLSARKCSDANPTRRVGFHRWKDVGALEEHYETYRKSKNFLGFDDILAHGYKLFGRTDFMCNCQHLLVDEFQDVNQIQYQIVMAMASHGNVTVVGDSNQCIYGFRLSDPSFLGRFVKEMPGCHITILEENYRSTTNIVEVCNGVAEKIKESQIRNDSGKVLELFSKRSSTIPVTVLRCGSSYREAQANALLCKTWHEYGGKWSECAILVRVTRQCLDLERGLSALQIPYRIVGGLSFFERDEIKALIGCIRLMLNPDDDLAFQNVCNVSVLRIGAVSMCNLSQAVPRTVSMYSFVEKYPNDPRVKKFKPIVNAISSFARRLGQNEMQFKDLLQEMAEDIGLCGRLKKSRPKEGEFVTSDECEENVKAMIEEVPHFIDTNEGGSLSSRDVACKYLDNINLSSRLNRANESKEEDSVVISTVHGAKGLEWPFVIIAGAQSDTFPIPMAASGKDLEEEKRLFYVALSRAKHFLSLTYAGENHFSGQRVDMTAFLKSTRFLSGSNGPPQTFLKHSYCDEKAMQKREMNIAEFKGLPFRNLVSGTAVRHPLVK